MVKKRVLSPLPVFDHQPLYDLFEEHDIKESHIPKLQQFLARNEGATFRDVPGLPARAYDVLEQHCSVFTSTVVEAKTSNDGSTTKLVVELQDGQQVETVIIRHLDPLDSTCRRVTLCVSSQVGCQMGCTFCATGTLGLLGHLSCGEIIEQLVFASREAKVTNVVFMGMGEPLHNYDAVIAAARYMTDGKRFGLGFTRVTVSTVGIAPKMREFVLDAPHAQLALSLHAPTQELRKTIVPAANSWDLDEIIAAVDFYIENTNRTMLIEYVLLAGVNDTEECCHQLGELMKDRDVHINLIPYNPTDVAADFQAPRLEDSQRFLHTLIDEYKILTTIRMEHGQDVDAACGQLTLTHNGPRGPTLAADIEDIGSKKKKGSAALRTKSKKKQQQVAWPMLLFGALIVLVLAAWIAWM